MQSGLAYKALSMIHQIASLLAPAKEIARAPPSVVETPPTGSSQRLCAIALQDFGVIRAVCTEQEHARRTFRKGDTQSAAEELV